jgi:hypothetical protein
MPSKVNSMNASSIAGYMKRYRNWQAKLYTAAREITLFNKGKKQQVKAFFGQRQTAIS